MPDTAIDSSPGATTDASTAEFTFHAIGASTGFECSLDGFSFEPCASPKTYTGLDDGPHSFGVRAVNGGTPDPSPATHTWTQVAPTPPPDPEDVAPSLPASQPTVIGDSTEFLYTGPDAIQTGVAPGTIDPERVAVLRGRVFDSGGLLGLPAVRITVVDHPELGQTVTRDDGRFDLAVNGGEPLTLSYEREDFMALQRTEEVPWQQFVDVEDVVMKAYDTPTPVDLAEPEIQVAEGSSVDDADGQRQAVLMFEPGTDAVMELADGSTKPLGDDLQVRATEFTVGPSGDEAMPGELPTSSGYTYAVELSVDEAVEAGASTVTFDKPVASYVDNFLEFPAGTRVPAAYYDRERAAWVPADDGVVIEILGEPGGVADVDADGDGAPDPADALATRGIDLEERKKLAELYDTGKTLWRVQVKHFTPWDYNWPYGLDDDAEDPDNPEDDDEPCPDCEGSGSTIGFLNQTLGEELDITGTPYSLHYSSRRAPGYKAAYTLNIPVSGASLPASLRQIQVDVSVGGREFTQTFAPTLNRTVPFTWDGNDAYGRPVVGSQPAKVRIGYVYEAVYLEPEAFRRSFARFGGTPISADRARREITLWQEWERPIGTLFDAVVQGVAGWTLSVHHAYDPAARALYTGDGGWYTSDAIKAETRTVAGGGFDPDDGGPALEAELGLVRGVAIGPDGSIYLAETSTGRVRRVGPDGNMETVAGGGNPADGLGDGLLATQAQLLSPSDVAVATDGRVFVSDTGNGRIRVVGLDGRISTYAGGGESGVLGDDGPATSAWLNRPRGIALAPDGTLYVADTFNHRVRQIAPDGFVTTAVGGGSPGDGVGDGGLATDAALQLPYDVAVDSNGALHVADAGHHRVRAVRSDGRIETVAGDGTFGRGGDGGPATEAQLGDPQGLAVGRNGAIFVVDRALNVVREVAVDGTISTFAGTGSVGFAGELAPPAQAVLARPQDAAVAPDGSVFLADAGNGRIRQASPGLPGFADADLSVPSQDGTELYLFTSSGRHTRTVDTVTGTVLHQFEYGPSGRLVKVTDRDGNVTEIVRDPAGNPIRIVAPGGQLTHLTTNPAGYLETVANEEAELTRLAYAPGGLLDTLTEPGGGVHDYDYDSLGRLIRDESPDGIVQTLVGTHTASGSTVEVTTSLGRETLFTQQALAGGGSRRTVTTAGGSMTATVALADGSFVTDAADGTRETVRLGPDPRWGMVAPVVAARTVETPAGVRYDETRRVTVQLEDELDLLSLRVLEDELTVNGSRRYTTETRALGPSTAPPIGWTVTRESPSFRRSVTTLDTKGRMVAARLQELGSAETTYAYDARGLLEQVKRGTEETNYVYDDRHRLISETDAATGKTEYMYDDADRVRQRKLPEGQVYEYTYDPRGKLETLRMPSADVHTFDSSPGNRLEGYEPPGSTGAHAWVYDDDGKPTSATGPGGGSETFAYDTLGRHTGTTGGPLVDTFTYPTVGARDRISSLTRTGAGATQTIDLDYDGFLLTSTAFSGAAAGTFTYGPYTEDLLPSRIRLESGVDVIDSPLAYDDDELLTSYGPFTYARSGPAGAVSSITATGFTLAYGYDAHDRVDTRTQTVNGVRSYRLELDYGDTGQVGEKREFVGSAPLRTTRYTYDLNGQLVQEEVVGVATTSYAFDDNGNRTTGGAAYDDQDRLTNHAGIAHTFDDDGFLAARGADTFDYSPSGALLSATVGGVNVSYAYDASGRRVSRTGPGGTHRYLYDSTQHEFQVAAVRSPSGELTRLFYDESDRLFALDRGGTRFYVSTDHVGSPRVVTDAAGAVVKTVSYDAFGRVTADSAPAFDLPIGFAGGLGDPVTGLLRFGWRDYDPVTGRWTAKDPTLFAGSPTNLYAYAGNDPVGGRDWSGLDDLPTPPLGPKPFPPDPKRDFPKKGKPIKEYDSTLDISREGQKGVEEFENPLKKVWKKVCDALAGDDGDKPPDDKPPPSPPPQLKEFKNT